MFTLFDSRKVCRYMDFSENGGDAPKWELRLGKLRFKPWKTMFFFSITLQTKLHVHVHFHFHPFPSRKFGNLVTQKKWGVSQATTPNVIADLWYHSHCTKDSSCTKVLLTSWPAGFPRLSHSYPPFISIKSVKSFCFCVCPHSIPIPTAVFHNFPY